MPHPLSLKDLFARALDTVGSKRIIFGTDSSWFPRGWTKKYFDLQTQVCTELGVSQEEMNAIFYHNAVTLLGLEQWGKVNVLRLINVQIKTIRVDTLIIA